MKQEDTVAGKTRPFLLLVYGLTILALFRQFLLRQNILEEQRYQTLIQSFAIGNVVNKGNDLLKATDVTTLLRDRANMLYGHEAVTKMLARQRGSK